MTNEAAEVAAELAAFLIEYSIADAERAALIGAAFTQQLFTDGWRITKG